MSFQFKLPCYKEKDGKLGMFEADMLPNFQVERVFYIYDVPHGETRANHACMNASSVFIALGGCVTLMIETGGIKRRYTLKDKSEAVFVPNASWVEAYEFSQDTVLLGLSNRKYQECEYITDYEEYKGKLKK